MSDLEIGTVLRVGDMEWGRGVEFDTNAPLKGPLRLYASADMLRAIGAHLYGRLMLRVKNGEVAGIVEVYRDQEKP